jgi:hypothetical protein
MNVDLCAAFHAALHGVASPTRSRLDPDEERIFVQFPAEWLRNPQSPTAASPGRRAVGRAGNCSTQCWRCATVMTYRVQALPGVPTKAEWGCRIERSPPGLASPPPRERPPW